ncbi:hypothetical protein E8E13_006540 [Curvularia kusanoi]|uniref:Piwi domain-containing protein n=1 Tax=Curvularia kusanoi TaxID=90978 RepID=A0A9P4T9B0_CURKU|nr:hypothetical protein E8E13_006540 [Curvularia kusanoi]
MDRDPLIAVVTHGEHPETPAATQFVLLRSDKATLYDAIRYVWDCQLGTPNICSIGQKFSKEKGQMQYFANVAMKFNQKLGGVNHAVDAKQMRWNALVSITGKCARDDPDNDADNDHKRKHFLASGEDFSFGFSVSIPAPPDRTISTADDGWKDDDALKVVESVCPSKYQG